MTVSYSAVGSSAGIAAFSARQVDFGASDVPMTASERAAASGGPVAQVPVALGGEGVVYNLSLPAGARLHLTGPVLAAIFLGQITRWNDPALTALNPGITLPAAPITVVHRSDGSGTTYIFSNYLSGIDPAWAARVGTGTTLTWPAGDGEEGNPGVAAAVYRTPFSIGYVEQAYSQGLLLPFAAIRNQQFGPQRDRMRAALARRAGIGATDLDALEHLEADGPLTQRDLGERPSLTSGAVTMLVDRLERAGWVHRRPHPGDRRYALIELSSRAAASAPEGLAAHHARIRALAAGVPPGQREAVAAFLAAAAATAAGEISR